MHYAADRCRFRLQLLALLIMALLSGCGNQGSGAPDSDEVLEEDASAEETAPEGQELSGPSQSFAFQDNRGYTYAIEVSNLTAISDISSAPPGYQSIIVGFDYTITNTTPGRDLPVSGLDFNVAAQNSACEYGPYDFDPDWCQMTVATIPPDEGVPIIGAGQSISGRIDPSGPQGATLEEAYDVNDLFYGFYFIGCQGECWMSLDGRPIPDGL